MSAAVVATGWLTAILAVGSAICGFLAAITDSWIVIFGSSSTNPVIRYGMMHLCTGSQCVAQEYVPVSGCSRSRDEVNERYRAIEAFLCIGSAFALLTVVLTPMIVLRARYNEYKREEWRAGGRCTALDIELLKASENVIRKRVIGLVFLQLIAFVSLALCLGLFATVYNSFAYCQPFCDYVKKTLSTTDCGRGYTWSLALAALIMTIISALSALILTLFFFRGYDKRFHGIVPNEKGTGEMEAHKTQTHPQPHHHDDQMYHPYPPPQQQYGQAGSSTNHEEHPNHHSDSSQHQQQQQSQKTAASEPIHQHNDQSQQQGSTSNRPQQDHSQPQDEPRRVQQNQSQGRDDGSRAPPSRSPQRRPAGDASRESSGNQPPRSTPQRSVSPQPSSSSSQPQSSTQSRSQQPTAQPTAQQNQQPQQQQQHHQQSSHQQSQQQQNHQQQDRSAHGQSQGQGQGNHQSQQQRQQEPANRGRNPLDSVGDEHVQSTPRRERYILEEHEAIILNLQGDDWEYVDSAQLYWSEEQKLYFDPNSTNFYDPQTDQWFDPDTGEWYILMDDGAQQPPK